MRLMESRKSLRLMDQHFDVDFARLAEGPITTIAAAVSGSVSTAASAAATQHDLAHPPRKRSSSGSTTGIDVPGAFVGSRKRRSSPSSNNSAGAADVVMDEDEDSDVMDECAAAMVLMRLSCSPHSPRWEELAAWQSNQSSTSSSSGAFSWRGSVSSNGDSPPHIPAPGNTVGGGGGGPIRSIGVAGRKLKFRSATPSPPLMSGSAPANYSGSVVRFHHQQAGSKDDGIASDESISECDEETQPARSVIYQCTWPGCSATTRNCADIEAHVRSLHLGPRQIDEEVSDHEEEFYYTEVEEDGTDGASSPVSPTSSTTPADLSPARQQELMHLQQHQLQQQGYYYQQQAGGVLSGHPGWMASSPPTLSHMDMARPPHEDPEYQRALMMKAASGSAARPIAIPARVRSISWSSGYGYGSNPVKQVKVSGGSPGSSSSTSGSSAKTSPNGHGGTTGMPTTTTTLSVKSSPVRRPRGEAKKCRKVYGMEHREQWCTQCKWKKACTRFGD